MNFFKPLSELMDNYDLNLTIRKKDGELTVSVLPKVNQKDKVKLTIRALNLSGTPEELDENFLKEVSAPLQKTEGVASNVAEYEKSIEEAETKVKEKSKGKGKSAAAKKDDKKDEKKSDPKPSKPTEEKKGGVPSGSKTESTESKTEPKAEKPTETPKEKDGGQIGMF